MSVLAESVTVMPSVVPGRWRRLYWALIVLLGLVLGAAAVVVYHSHQAVNLGYHARKQVSYSYTLRNTGNRVRRDVTFWVYAPVAQTAFQRTADLQADAPFTQETDAFGNQRLAFQFERLAPFETRVIKLQTALEIATQAQSLPATPARPTPYLQAERYIEVDDAKIVALARRLQSDTDTPEQSARHAFDWVVGNVQPTTYQARALGAKVALQQQQGDCTEFAYLYAALTRNQGIPSRVIGGYRYADSAVLRAEDYHNWVEILLDDRWRVVDPHGGRFLDDEDQYVAMTVLHRPDAGMTSPLGHQQRFLSTDAVVSVRLN